MNSITKIGNNELVAMCKFVVRMFNAVRIPSFYEDDIEIQNKTDVLRCLDFMSIGLSPTAFLMKVVGTYPDYESNCVFTSIEDAISFVEDGIECLMKKAKGETLFVSHYFLNGMNNRSYNIETAKRRIKKAFRYKKQLLLLRDAYKKIARHVPDIKNVECECEYNYNKAWLSVDLEHSKQSASSAARQLRALGLVA